MPVFRLRLVALVSAVAISVGMISLVAVSTASAKSTRTTDKTRATEARRMKAVTTPKLRWYACYGYAECATVRLPLDYDRPKGARTEIALLRVKASDRKHRVGSLFVNPGGPGGSGTELAYFSPDVFSPQLRRKFDIVGFDPRGTNFSSSVKCFPSSRQLTPVLDTIASTAFPYTTSQESEFIRAYRKLGRACSTTGKPLSVSMSTAQVARDMDVLRRAVGDKKLSYLGFSYGSYLGQVYANMFPDRVRAVAIDGVVDPIAWAGTRATRQTPQGDRLRSADGATKALREILVRCDRAGGRRCRFAPGDPVANFDLVAERLKKKPLVEVDPFTGEEFRFGYPDLIGAVLGSLYSPYGYSEIADNLAELIILTEPRARRNVAASKLTEVQDTRLRLAPTGFPRASTPQRKAAVKRLVINLNEARKREQGRDIPGRLGFPYDNSLDTFTAISCSDSLNPQTINAYPAAAAAADQRAQYFGRLWTWNLSVCARDSFTGRDEDAYRGPFTKRTRKPVLVVGNTWDPATNYRGAVKAASLLPNSRLLASDSWGHTAYGTSGCVTSAVDRYLIRGELPRKGTRCVGDIQPFTAEPDDFTTSQLSLRREQLVGSPVVNR